MRAMRNSPSPAARFSKMNRIASTSSATWRTPVTRATVSMDFYDRRFTISLAHRDTAMRDVAISAMQRLAIFVTREIQGRVTMAANISKAGGTVPTTPSDPQWVEKLVTSQYWLGHAYSRGLLTVTDLKGKPIKPTTATAKAQPRVVRDPWLGR